MNDVLLYSRAGVCAWLVSATCYSRVCRLLAHCIDVMRWSPVVYPRKHLGRGVVNGPQNYSNIDKGQEGRLFLLPSLSRVPDSILKLLASTLLHHQHLLPGPWWSGWGRLSIWSPRRTCTVAILHRQKDLSSSWSLTRQFPLWRWIIITVHVVYLHLTIVCEQCSH
jgi:hypothetical protein